MRRERRGIAGALALAAIVAIAAQLSCSGAGGLPAEEVRRRLMQRQQLKLHQRLFFVGIADGATLEQATQNAYDEITRQLSWLPDRSRQLLRGLYRVDRSASDRSGRVHVLVVLEREAASARLVALAEEERKALGVALAGCEEVVKDGDVSRARACLLQRVTPGVERVRALLAASRAAVGDRARPAAFAEERRAAALEHSIGAAEVRGRSVLVGTQALADGRRQGSLGAELRQAVTSAGLKLAAGSLTQTQITAAIEGTTEEAVRVGRAAGAGHVVVGAVVAQYSSEDRGQYFAWASGRLRVMETASGKVVAELSCDRVKGGHISRRQASAQALHKALARLAQDLQRELRALSR